MDKDTVAQLTQITIIQLLMVAQAVARMLLLITRALAVQLIQILGIQSKRNVFQLAHVKDVVTSTAVMN